MSVVAKVMERVNRIAPDYPTAELIDPAYYPLASHPAAVAITLLADGSAVVRTSAQEVGAGTATMETQHAAERLGLPLARVRFEYGASNLPHARPVANEANPTVDITRAVQDACETLHRELLRLASRDPLSPLANARLEDVEAINGGLYLRTQPGKGTAYAALLSRAGKSTLEARATVTLS